MNCCKQALLELYYQGTRPLRARQMRQWVAAGRAPLMALFYHRIADSQPNPWTTSRAVFARQIEWMQQHLDLISLGELQRRLVEGNRRPAVCITFDDGYSENCDWALPYLIERGVPVTYFIATQLILDGSPFPHDAQRGEPLRPHTPGEILQLADAGVEIAGHTRTHADLGAIQCEERLLDEIVLGKQETERLSGRPARYFSFPFGLPANLNRRAFEIARDCGYECVCSAYGGYNFPGDDPFHVQRIHPDNDLVRLKNWLTVDPRKLRSVQRYQYRLPSAEVPQKEVQAGAPECTVGAVS